MAHEKILIVEDDEVTALHLQLALKKLSYNVVEIAKDTLQARNRIKIYEPDLVLLDISLQAEADGIALASFLQENFPVPYIYLTSHTEQTVLEQAKVTQPYGYIVKPFDIESLHTTIQMAIYKFAEEQKQKRVYRELQIKASDLEKMLFNQQPGGSGRLEFQEGFALDIATNELFYEGSKIRLTQKESAFMALLVAHREKRVTFAQAIAYVWPDEGASENSVRTLVWRLRNKLPKDIIENVSGVGYTLS